MSTEFVIEANVSKKILFEALDLAKEFEAKYSAYKEDSLVSKINNLSGVEGVVCTPKEIEIFQKSLEIAELSKGLFDPTIGALTQGLYGFGKKTAKIPKPQELQNTKKLVNFKNLQISNNEVFLTQKGMKLDLGGIGKGYIADKIINFLQQKGATKALVSAGGEIVTLGKEYHVALKNPFEEGNSGIFITTKSPLSISTSGDYERYIGSKEHHHILHAATAKPNHYYSSLTLIQNGHNATLLDGVTTIAYNSHKESLKKLAQRFGVAIIAITPDKEIYFENFSQLDLKSFEIYPF